MLDHCNIGNQKIEKVTKENHRYVTFFVTNLRRCQFCYGENKKIFGISLARNKSRKTQPHCCEREENGHANFVFKKPQFK